MTRTTVDDAIQYLRRYLEVEESEMAPIVLCYDRVKETCKNE